MLRCLILFLLLPSLYSGQNFVDLLELDYRLSPQIPLSSDTENKEDIKDLHARILAPLLIDSSMTVLTSLSYDQVHITAHRLHAITGIFGLDWQVNSKTRALALLLPKLSSDLENLTGRDMQIGSIAMLKKSLHDNFEWKAGVFASRELFGPLVVPILGFQWQANPSLRIEASLPISAHIRKSINSKVITGIKYSGRKYSFNLSEESSYMEVADNHVWAYADIYLSMSWVMHCRAGHSVLRDYSIHSNEDRIEASFGPVNLGDNRPESLYQRENGASFQIGIRYRYSLD